MELSAGYLAVTQLLDEIKAMIMERGPITVEQYMQLALAHPDLGYYMKSRSIRRNGRFHHGAGDIPDVRRADRALGG